MEQMVPELEDMQKKSYFSKQEIKEIVRKRQEFEYKLKRKSALKEDFLRWVAGRRAQPERRWVKQRGG
jgi:U3 small nucleolar RNA-associated protein 6